MDKLIDEKKLTNNIENAISNCDKPLKIDSVYFDDDKLKTIKGSHIIGICGKSGSGKSTLANEIIKNLYYKVVHLNIDEVGHRALTQKEVINELINTFGESIILDNIVDRKKLGDIVFSSRDDMDKLTLITWEYMEKEIDKFINENKDSIIILDWLLLPKTKFFSMCDYKILLDIPYDIRLKRALQRDGITKEKFDLREKSSIEFNEHDFDFVFKDNKLENVRKLVKLL